MRAFALFCGGMADEPREELSGRTPLEVAKTPFLDSLVRAGKLGTANFTPRALSPAEDIACLSILGYDPTEFYTGLAPLEAMAMGVPQDDRDVTFRCDFITVADDTFVDVADRISQHESRHLADDLNAALQMTDFRFYAGSNSRGILVFKGTASDELDDLECVPPPHAAGKKISKILPQGKGARILAGFVEKAKKVLTDHEINRVRIDLKENPANMVWPWGQGKKPKLPAFSERTGLRGTVVSDSLAARGIGQACGLSHSETLAEALKGDSDFVFAYLSGKNADVKEKIRRIEEFDKHTLGPVCRYAAKHPDVKILIGTDLLWPSGRAPQAGETPFLIHGQGVDAEPAERFTENTAKQKRFVFDDGYKLLFNFIGKKP